MSAFIRLSDVGNARLFEGFGELLQVLWQLVGPGVEIVDRGEVPSYWASLLAHFLHDGAGFLFVRNLLEPWYSAYVLIQEYHRKVVGELLGLGHVVGSRPENVALEVERLFPTVLLHDAPHNGQIRDTCGEIEGQGNGLGVLLELLAFLRLSAEQFGLKQLLKE